MPEHPGRLQLAPGSRGIRATALSLLAITTLAGCAVGSV
jgi:hypothetical protein